MTARWLVFWYLFVALAVGGFLLGRSGAALCAVCVATPCVTSGGCTPGCVCVRLRQEPLGVCMGG